MKIQKHILPTSRYTLIGAIKCAKITTADTVFKFYSSMPQDIVTVSV